MAKACNPWYPTIFPDKCDGCASYEAPKCVEYCPNNVFALKDGKAVVANPHKRVYGCIACEPLCHAKAIVFPKPELGYVNVKAEDKGLLKKLFAKSAVRSSGQIGKPIYASTVKGRNSRMCGCLGVSGCSGNLKFDFDTPFFVYGFKLF